MLNLFRKVAIWEGISYLVLMTNMILKRIFVYTDLTMTLGMMHGILFIGYCILLAIVANKYGWSLKTIAIAFVASLLPFGTFVADKKIFSKQVA